MKRETLLDAFQYIDDRYLDIAEKEKPAMKMEIEDLRAPKAVSRRGRSRKTALIAAAVAAVLTLTALAISYFTMSGREAYEGEKYRIVWGNENGFLEWTNLQYVFKFEGGTECRGAKFKEGWLPFAPNDEVNDWAKDKEGWRTRLVSECAPGVDSTSDNFQPYCIDLYYAPQFINGGALLLMAQEPDEIIEEQWGDERVMKFTASQHQEARDIEELDIHIPEKTMHFSFVLRFDPDRGTILVISGTSDMETIEHIAREVQLKETDEIIRSSDFENNCTFMDVSQG